MKHDHFVVQSPDKPAKQLLLLFHGVGDNPVSMGEIGSGSHRYFQRRWWSALAARNLVARRLGVSGFGSGCDGREPPGAG